MKIKDVMTTNVVTLDEHAPFKEVVKTLLTYDVSGAPVVDAEGRLLGIVSEADLLSKEAYPARQRRALLEMVSDMLAGREIWIDKASGLCARDIMTSGVETARPDEEVRTVARRMLQSRLKRLPVVADGKVVGIVSRHDILRVLARKDDDVKAGVERILDGSLFVPPDYEIRVSVEDGVVTLEGEVVYEDDVRVAGNLAGSVEGVVGVRNALVNREPNPRLVGRRVLW